MADDADIHPRSRQTNIAPSAAQEVLRELLREYRVRAEVTQVELSARLGVAQSWVAKTENGYRRLEVLELLLICRALGVALGDFAAELDRRVAQTSVGTPDEVGRQSSYSGSDALR